MKRLLVFLLCMFCLTGMTSPGSAMNDGSFEGAILGEIGFESGITKIPNYTFIDCKRVMSVTIPSTVTVIGKGAFMRCSKLTTVVLPETLTEIQADAFKYCTALKDINVPAGTTIGSNAFKDCSSLEVIPQ